MGYFSYLWRLVKEIKNPALFVYHCFHYANRSVSGFLVRYIRNKNLRCYERDNIGDILIQTIDGSSQIVHPDMDLFNGSLALICTPYPYAMEEYENPCVYMGKGLDSLKMVFAPLDVQYERTQGVHLSDPCIASDEKNMFCVYRDTRYKDDFIYIKKVYFDSSQRLQLSDRYLLLDKKQEYAYSPAIILKNETMLMYHVETDRKCSKRVLNIYNKESFSHLDVLDIHISNEPYGFYLWHIGIAVSNGFGKLQKDDDSLVGLFLYISANDNRNIKLYRASSFDNIHWSIGNEVLMPDIIKDIIKFPYKSCFIPNSDRILLSFRDKNSRNRIIQISIAND